MAGHLCLARALPRRLLRNGCSRLLSAPASPATLRSGRLLLMRRLSQPGIATQTATNRFFLGPDTMQPLILVADDNEDNRIILHVMLEHEGFAVIEAENGAEAVEAARRHRPSLILMDIRMPVVDGWEAVALLQADDITRSIPVIAYTAHDDPARTDHAIQAAGFCACVRKPAAPRKVAAAVRLCLQEIEGGASWTNLGHLQSEH